MSTLIALLSALLTLLTQFKNLTEGILYISKTWQIFKAHLKVWLDRWFKISSREKPVTGEVIPVTKLPSQTTSSQEVFTVIQNVDKITICYVVSPTTHRVLIIKMHPSRQRVKIARILQYDPPS